MKILVVFVAIAIMLSACAKEAQPEVPEPPQTPEEAPGTPGDSGGEPSSNGTGGEQGQESLSGTFNAKYNCDKTDAEVNVKYRKDSVMLYLAMPGGACRRFLYDVNIKRSYPEQWRIDLTSEKVKGCVEIQCVGVSEATLNIPLSNEESVGSVSVYLDGKELGSITTSEVMCGGLAAFACPSGYECKYDGDYPDAAGKCIVLK